MSLSKRAFGQIIQASARSDSPIEDEVLIEIAQENGDDPEAVLEIHREWRQDWKDRKDAERDPMPFIVT